MQPNPRQFKLRMFGSRLAAAALFIAAAQAGGAAEVEIKPGPEKSLFEVRIGGKHFTNYCYDEKEFPDKPVCYPVLSPAGTPVNRMFPMVKGVPGESSDHPHQQSMWFTYGAVNGIDYWNLQKNGRRIKQRSVEAAGDSIDVVLDWTDPQGVKVLEEKRRMTFGGGEDAFYTDWSITLTANEADVEIGDSKEGAFGMRLAETLIEKTGGTGRYLNAEGLETSKNLWGKKSPWVALSGTVKGKAGDEPVTIAIYAHPKSFNSPPRWHARDYGLFTVNSFADKSYDAKAEARSTKLKKGEKLELRYRLAVYSGKAGADRLAADYAAFSK